MLVEQQQIRLAQGGHQQGQRLTLTPDSRPTLLVMRFSSPRPSVLAFTIQLAFLVRDTGAEAALLTAAVCQRQILL